MTMTDSRQPELATNCPCSAWRSGSPHCLPRRRPRSSRMSHSLSLPDEPECATSSNIRVGTPMMHLFSWQCFCANTRPDTKIVYRRYASLFFIAGCSSDDNELITLEIIHRYVEQMDKYYGNVCELDIIFSFTKAYYILDEILLAGELQESSKKNVLRCISQQDSLEDMEVSMPISTAYLPLEHIHTRALSKSSTSLSVLSFSHTCHAVLSSSLPSY